jgi:hypothetical protein
MPTGGNHPYRSLQFRLNKLLERRLRELHFHNGNLIPNFQDLPPGVRTVIQEQVLGFGEASLMAPEAEDIPLTAVQATENEYRAVMVAAAFEQSWAETMAQQAASSGVYVSQVNTRRTKMDAARRVIEEKLNTVAAYGVSSMSFTGLLNNANVTLTNSSFNPFSDTTTPDDLAAWFLDEIGDVLVDSNNVEYPTTALVSTELNNLMNSRRMPDSGETVKSYILRTQREANPNGQTGIKEIYGLQECRSASLESRGVQSGGTNKDRIVLYDKIPENLERHLMPGMMSMVPEEWVAQKGMSKIYPLYSCVSETIINFPGAIRYLDHAKKA